VTENDAGTMTSVPRGSERVGLVTGDERRLSMTIARLRASRTFPNHS
jgi:hypothetical protein